MLVRTLLLSSLHFLMTSIVLANGVDKHSDDSVLTDTYEKYSKSTNASDRQDLKLLLQRQLDKAPAKVLAIPDLDAANICDGSDIDADSGVDKTLMLKKVNQRIKKIISSPVAQEKKSVCLASLEKFKACIAAPGIEQCK